jgi:hypothetical protein
VQGAGVGAIHGTVGLILSALKVLGRAQSTMIAKHVVNLALKYLDETLAKSELPTLIVMLEYVDYYDRSIMVLDEVNQIFRERPGLCVQRVDGKITFTMTEGDRVISAEDLGQSIHAYDVDFWERYRKLKKEKPLHHGKHESEGPLSPE